MPKPIHTDAVTAIASVDSCDLTGTRRMPRLFCDRKVSTKIVLVVAAVATTAVAVGWAGLDSLGLAHRQANAMHESFEKTVTPLDEARTQLLLAATAGAGVAGAQNATDAAAAAEQFTV